MTHTNEYLDDLLLDKMQETGDYTQAWRELEWDRDTAWNAKRRLQKAGRCPGGDGTAPSPKFGDPSRFVQTGHDTYGQAAPEFTSDKKQGQFDWREAGRLAQGMQGLSARASWSQDEAVIDFSYVTRPLMVIIWGDSQIGSYGTDYAAFTEWTDFILQNNIHLAVVGDMAQLAIKMRGVLEMMDNLLPPKLQMRFIESWFAEIGHLILFWTWCNHGTERLENATGIDSLAEIVNRRVIVHNHIGHPNVLVGGQLYKLCASHYFKGKATETNPLNGLMKYLRMEAPDRDCAMAGDTHRPAIAQYTEGAATRTVVNCGTMQTNSGFAKRYFSLAAHMDFPCIALRHDRKEIVPFWDARSMVECFG